MESAPIQPTNINLFNFKEIDKTIKNELIVEYDHAQIGKVAYQRLNIGSEKELPPSNDKYIYKKISSEDGDFFAQIDVKEANEVYKKVIEERNGEIKSNPFNNLPPEDNIKILKTLYSDFEVIGYYNSHKFLINQLPLVSKESNVYTTELKKSFKEYDEHLEIEYVEQRKRRDEFAFMISKGSLLKKGYLHHTSSEQIKELMNKCPNLKILNIYFSDITSLPKECDQLERLTLHFCNNLNEINELHKLKYLLTSSENLIKIGNMRNLMYLSCGISMPELGNMPNLERFKLWDNNTLTELTKLPSVKSITCANCSEIRKIDLSNVLYIKLINCPKLTEVNFPRAVEVKYFNCPNLNQFHVPANSKIEELKELPIG